MKAGDLKRAKEASKAERIWRTTGASKKGQVLGIEKQLEEVNKQLALLAMAMEAASPKQEAAAKRAINSNKARVEEEKSKEAEGRKIKEIKRQAEERRKKEEEALREAEKLAGQVQAVKDSQRTAAEACEAEVDSLTKINKNNLSAKDLMKLGEKLKEAMGMKTKIEEECNREVENRVGDKKQVVNGKILKMVRIVVAHMNPIDGRGKADLEQAVGETSKLLDELARTNRSQGWKVKATAGTGSQNDESLWEVSRVPEEISPSVVTGVLGRQLVAVIGRTGDLMNAWQEEDTFKMLVLDAPMV